MNKNIVAIGFGYLTLFLMIFAAGLIFGRWILESQYRSQNNLLIHCNDTLILHDNENITNISSDFVKTAEGDTIIIYHIYTNYRAIKCSSAIVSVFEN